MAPNGKTARTIARKQPAAARTARRPTPAAASAKAKPSKPAKDSAARLGARTNKKKPGKPSLAAAPRLSRIVKNIDLVPPPDCIASLVLKQVAHDTYRYYACWLLVGRYDVDALNVKYKFTGENSIRCDIPLDGEVSLAALQPYLETFLAGEGKEPDGPPVVVGGGKPK